MDAERGRAVQPNRRVGKLAVVVAVQNVLVVVCLLVTFYVYQDFKAWASEDIVHIRFDPIQATSGNTTLQFLQVGSSYLMDLSGQSDQISIKCSGFYVWHMLACYGSMEPGKAAAGKLQLRVAGSETPLSSLTLNATMDDVCRGLHSIIYLRKDQLASVHSLAPLPFKIRNVTVGLSYIQGKKCAF